MEKHERKLELAARAAWLYYIANNTQDEIATKLDVSRQAAQRLVSMAVTEKLIKFRLDHPLAACIELAETLRSRYELTYCDVAPSDPESEDPDASLGGWAAGYLETCLSAKAPTVYAFSTGRTLRAAVNQIQSMTQPQHKIVSLVGNMAHDGRASHYEIVMHLADRINAQAFLMPTPVVASSAEEREFLQKQRSFLAVRDLASQAKLVVVGIGEIGWNCPLHKDGFINDIEVAELLECGAVCDLLAWAFDKDGALVEASTNARVAGLALSELPAQRTVAVAGGARKVEAIRAVLRGKLVAGLITDETTARALLAAH
jgi:DNA-binding transcriptional regulator LsrR (DeoR family)